MVSGLGRRGLSGLAQDDGSPSDGRSARPGAGSHPSSRLHQFRPDARVLRSLRTRRRPEAAAWRKALEDASVDDSGLCHCAGGGLKKLVCSGGDDAISCFARRGFPSSASQPPVRRRRPGRDLIQEQGLPGLRLADRRRQGEAPANQAGRGEKPGARGVASVGRLEQPSKVPGIRPGARRTRLEAGWVGRTPRSRATSANQELEQRATPHPALAPSQGWRSGICIHVRHNRRLR